eukprot:6808-Heterococcus_DN1.PRE.3
MATTTLLEDDSSVLQETHPPQVVASAVAERVADDSVRTKRLSQRLQCITHKTATMQIRCAGFPRHALLHPLTFLQLRLSVICPLSMPITKFAHVADYNDSEI